MKVQLQLIGTFFYNLVINIFKWLCMVDVYYCDTIIHKLYAMILRRFRVFRPKKGFKKKRDYIFKFIIYFSSKETYL